MLFAPAFPLAPLLALVNNIIEIRSSSYRLVKGYRRPVWKAREGIGTWMNVLDTLGFLAVITNAAMISFVGKQVSAACTGPASLIWVSPHGESRYTDTARGFLSAQRAKVLNVPDELTVGLHDRLGISALWFNFMAVEHMAMFLRVVILAITPKTPTWIRVAKETLDFRTRTFFKTNEQKDTEKRCERFCAPHDV